MKENNTAGDYLKKEEWDCVFISSNRDVQKYVLIIYAKSDVVQMYKSMSVYLSRSRLWQ